MEENQNTNIATEEEKANESQTKKKVKKPFNKKKLIIGISIAAAVTTVIAIAVPITLAKLFPSMNMSFLKNYQALIQDAECLGISLENKTPSLVKQTEDNHEIVNVPFVKKKKSSTGKRSPYKGDSEYLKNIDGVLNRYLVYEDYTFVEYVAKKSELIQEEGGAANYYYPAYYRTWNAYDSWLSSQLMVKYREDQYINEYSIDENGITDFDKYAEFTWNKTHQSFVIDNRTGYIYPLDFLNVGESIKVVNGALSLNIPRENDWWLIDRHLVEFSIDNDNLVITNIVKNEGLRYEILCKDKYGQYFVIADIMNDQIDEENKVYAFNKGYGSIYEYGTGISYRADEEFIYNRADKELAIFTEMHLSVFEDGFVKNNTLESYSTPITNGYVSFSRQSDGTYSQEKYTISYVNPGEEGMYTFRCYSATDSQFEFQFYSMKAINDLENDKIVLIRGKEKEDNSGYTLAAYSVKIKTVVEKMKEGIDLNDIIFNDGEVFYEGFDNYRVYKEKFEANYCLLEIRTNNLSGTDVYILTEDEDGNYVFVKKESYTKKDIIITISPINKD